MNGNSIAKQIEKQTGLKKSKATKKYAQETGRGNIAYAMRFAGYRYDGDFHVDKYLDQTYRVVCDSKDARARIGEIKSILEGLGLEIKENMSNLDTIYFEIPREEGRWYGESGWYNKGPWNLHKIGDDYYYLTNRDDENYQQRITAYTPYQAKYSADSYIEQYEKGRIMNSRKPIKSSFDKTIFSKSPNDCRNEKIADIYFTVHGEPMELVFKMDSDWDRAYLNYIETGAMIEIPENDKNSPLYQVIENLIGKPIEFDDLTLTDIYAAHQIESSRKSSIQKRVVKSSKHILKSGYYNTDEHPEGGGTCDYCQTEIAPGDGYEKDFQSTRDTAVQKLYKALGGDDKYSYQVQTEGDLERWLRQADENIDEDYVNDMINDVINTAFENKDGYMCHDCLEASLMSAAEEWVEENW